MRSLLVLLLTTAPALAWQAGIDGQLCTLTHTEAEAHVRLTYDPSGPLYSITVTRPEPWSEGPSFAIVFMGGQENTIQTNRHVLSEDRRSLTVIDRGFGNVLDGLAFNTVAVMGSGDVVLRVSLEGAAPEVAVFEDCGTVPAV